MDTNNSTSSGRGITSQQAGILLKQNGPNELPSQKDRGLLHTIRSVIKEPMFMILVAAGVIYLILGEIQDALLLSSFIVFVLGVTIYQERKTERAVAALRKLSSPRATVIRDGKEVRIPSREIVPGDTVIVKTGDRIPADGYCTNADNFLVDESVLTGESLPVGKRVWEDQDSDKHLRPGGENQPLLWAGTLVNQGRAELTVTATGTRSVMGKIGVSLGTIEDEETLLRKEIQRLVKIFVVIGAVLCLSIVLYWAFFRESLLAGILAGLTLSMSMLPEEFPVVLTIFFTLGAWRLAKKNVLVRKTAIIETLGAATTLCVDKTGTITANTLTLDFIFMKGQRIPLTAKMIPSDAKDVLHTARLASALNPSGSLEKTIKNETDKRFPRLGKRSRRLDEGERISDDEGISCCCFIVAKSHRSNYWDSKRST